MQDVPKIVLKRLQETAAAGTHPDADLLTALVERSLGETERARVMEHLSSCKDCREVVALVALPATEVAAMNVSVAPTPGSWFGWPVVRWGVAVAGIIAIASIGVVQYRQRQENETLVSSLTSSNETSATADVAPSPSPAVPETKEAPSPAEKQRQTDIRKKMLPSRKDNLFADRFVVPPNPARPKAQAMRGAAARSASRGALGFANAGAGVVPNAAPPSSSGDTFTGSGNLKNATPAETAKLAPNLSGGQAGAVPSSSSQTIEVESQGESVTASTESQVSDQLIENKKQQPLSYQSSPTVGVVATKGAATAQAVSGMLRAAPRWSIGADGALLRSFDAGNTWVYVNVNSEPAANRSKVARSAENTYESNKSKVKAQLNLVFRAVVANGSDVWAGGSAAMLYHSSDSGAHWTRELSSSSGAALTGDITSIEFSDSQHGRIVTSTGEVWITSDDGQTWTRQ
jgi:Photosynthesis system II assembly factor YCF48/Putative zinc-finger